MRSAFDHDNLVNMFAEATAGQGEMLRNAVRDSMLKALQGRELTLDSVREVLAKVTQAAAAGAAKNPASAVDVEALLAKVLAGMDGALLQAVEAHRKAMQQFVEQGADLKSAQLQGALSQLEKMEEVFFSTVAKAVQDAGTPLLASWQQALQTFKLQGSDTGAQAGAAVQQLLAQAQEALRDGRAGSMRVAQVMLDSYTALVSGVLIGMSEGLQPVGTLGKSRKK